MSEAPLAQPPLESETGLVQREKTADHLDATNQLNIVSTENSVVSSSTSETALNGQKISSSASTATSISTSSSGTSSKNTDEKKEQIDIKQAANNDKSRTPIVLQMNAPPHPVAEFLFQLTKMLTDDNKEYIEWRKGSIYVLDPPGLEKFILPKYFRHSNYSSFQRQMNYFGFRKIAGKGKMAPCSYVNENAKEDISSLLFIKRKKTGVSNKAANVIAQHQQNMNHMGGMNSYMMGAPGLIGGLSHPSLLSLNGHVPGIGGGLGHQLMPNQVSNNSFNDAALYREQQQMLVQLQHAHASASSDLGLPTTHSNGLGGQSKSNSSFGSSLFNSGVQTTDQGNVYQPSTDNSEWQIQYPNTLNPQSQQFRANPSQGSAMGIDSSANLRALLNQQISLFNNPDPNAPSATLPNSLAMPTRQDSQPSNTTTQNDQKVAAPGENDVLIRQLEQQLFEAQNSNGMGGVNQMGMPKGNGN